MLKRLRGQGLAQDIFALYLTQFVQVLLPIAITPFLARRLGPQEWGTIAYFQSFALYIGMVIEYGFGLSATRKVAANPDSGELRSETLCEVGSSKLLLTLIACAIAIALMFTLPEFSTHPIHALAATVWGISQGANMVWYFQGIRQIRRAAFIELIGRGIAAAIAIVLVRSSADGYRFLLAMAGGSVVATLAETVLSYRTARFRIFTFGKALIGLKEGLTLFFFRSAVSLYTLGNSFILGTMAAPVIVGYYAGAERISKGILSFTGPIYQTMFAEINRLMAIDEDRARVRARQSLVMMVGLGTALGLTVFFGAPMLVRFLLGPAFGPAVAVTRVMALLPPLVCMGTSLGSNWMLPLHFDRAFNIIILAAGLLNVTLAILLAPRFGAIGMGISVVTCEAVVAILCAVYLSAVGKSLFTFRAARKISPIHADPLEPVAID